MSKPGYVTVGNIQVHETLHRFIMNPRTLAKTGLCPHNFLAIVADVFAEFAPKNAALLAKRDAFQLQIDDWHKANKGKHNTPEYEAFLREIGYLAAPVPDFEITTSNTDDEVRTVAGPQLVVPVMNARYAVNAANARWGSLYDSLYGTDAIPSTNGCGKTKQYNPKRGAVVIAAAKAFLDDVAPLQLNKWDAVSQIKISKGRAAFSVANNKEVGLRDEMQFCGFTGSASEPSSLLLAHNNLHIQVLVDRKASNGRTDPAGIQDVILEAATTVIMDCEDSVAAVDADDKVAVYDNISGLILGDLSATFASGGGRKTRTLAADRSFTLPNGFGRKKLKGKALMLFRSVGHLMTTNAVLSQSGDELPEGILDTLMISAMLSSDIRGELKGNNSSAGSIYIVKPKMHGPEEVAFADALFARVEERLSLGQHTLKIGIMDEEKRTSVNLHQCIREVKDRVFFVNTGFLDRTGDEIHTCMYAGPVQRKGMMKKTEWISAYEKNNVLSALRCGFVGRAQIGKGMWGEPDSMGEMLRVKGSQLEAGATTAWVPSPTAAVLHATHYHRVSVQQTQATLLETMGSAFPSPDELVKSLLRVPILTDTNLSDKEVDQELSNNAQSLLGYVVRWIDAGIGCSKVPDINDVGLMEDRATLRISSQHMANWLLHGLCTRDQVERVLEKMSLVVDKQNAGDSEYEPMHNRFRESVAFQAALELVFQGREQPSGYTEPVLHRRRLEKKSKGPSAKL